MQTCMESITKKEERQRAGKSEMLTSRVESALFTNVTQPVDYVHFGYGVTGLASLFLCFYVWAGWRLFQKTTAMKREATKAKFTLRLVWGNLVSTFVCNSFIFSLATLHGFDREFCFHYGGVGAMMYILAAMFSYLILQVRAEAALRSDPRFQSKLYRYTMFFTKVATGSFPLLTILGLFMFQGKVFFKEGRCMQTIDWRLSGIVAFLDTSLSILYLFLFVAPVFAHLKSAEQNTSNQQENIGKLSQNHKQKANVRRLAKRNLKLSSLTILSTFVFLVFTTALGAIQPITEEDPLYPQKAKWALLQIGAASVDIFVKCIVVLLMTNSLSTTAESRRRSSVQPERTTSTKV